MKQPLFIQNRERLRELVQVPAGSSESSDGALDHALSVSRANLYRRLGRVLVDQLKASPSVENPTTDAEIDRAIAESCERSMVFLMLLRDRPTFLLDSSFTDRMSWNEEPLLRRAQSTERKQLMQEISEEIESMIADLKGVVGGGDGVFASHIGTGDP